MDLYYPQMNVLQELALQEQRQRQQRLEGEASRGRSTWRVRRAEAVRHKPRRFSLVPLFRA